MSIATAILASATVLATQQYSVRALAPVATSPGAVRFEPGTRATAISADGSAGGSTVTDTATRDVHACRWRADGTAIDLGTLGADVHSSVLGGNAAGDLVGTSFSLGKRVVHGVLWRVDGTTVALGDMDAIDVNASRVVAANVNATGLVPASKRAARWTAGATAVLPPLAGGPSAQASAINDAGWIVGCGVLADRSTTHACLWTATGVPADLGTLGGATSFARAISGTVVVGVADTPSGVPHACRWRLNAQGGIVAKDDLGMPKCAHGSAAEAISTDGRIGGNAGDAAIIFTDEGPVDLNTLIPAESGWQLTHVTAFGDGGRILGRGRFHGLPRGFILEPTTGGCAADLNGDGAVNAGDLAIILHQWGSSGTADLDGSGTVDAADLSIALFSWGPCGAGLK